MNPDGMTGFLVAAAPSAAGVLDHLTVTADADPGTGTSPISGVSDDGSVLPAPVPLASVVNITLGAPEAVPAA
jgi:hypothetical protein